MTSHLPLAPAKPSSTEVIKTPKEGNARFIINSGSKECQNRHRTHTIRLILFWCEYCMQRQPCNLPVWLHLYRLLFSAVMGPLLDSQLLRILFNLLNSSPLVGAAQWQHSLKWFRAVVQEQQMDCFAADGVILTMTDKEKIIILLQSWTWFSLVISPSGILHNYL